MDSPSRSSVIIVGAGVSGICAAKVLAENGVTDLLILEASNRIGGRIRKENFGGLQAELGAGWIAGVGGRESNPVWELACKLGLRTCFSDYSNARYNIYDRSGKIIPSGIAADSYKKAVDSAIQSLRNQELGGDEPPPSSSSMPKTPIELAIDFILHDFEMAEVEPISTFVDFGEREFLVADERGFEYFLYKLAEDFLHTSEGKILDSRLQLDKVVQEIHHSRSGVTVVTEDGCIYEADYLILSVSIGVLQSDLITFNPPLPRWKSEAIEKLDLIVYTKIFLKFPYKFWPSGPEKEFFIYAHDRRGYYTFWQDMENAYPDSNVLVVTLTNEESKRVEAQPDEETLKEAMEVLRDMFGPDIPDAIDILVPRWWNNRFQRCSYSNYPIVSNNNQLNHNIKQKLGKSHFSCKMDKFYVPPCGLILSLDMVQAPVDRIYYSGEHTSEKFNGYVHGAYLAGIDTSKALLEDMRKEIKERKSESQTLFIEPFIACTDKLTNLSQPDTVSSPHKCDIPTQKYLSGKVGFPEAIL